MNADTFKRLQENLQGVKIGQKDEEVVKRIGTPTYVGPAYKPTLLRGMVKVGTFYIYSIKRVGRRSDSMDLDDRYLMLSFAVNHQLVSIDSCVEGIASRP
jgi:hypothetical protein